MLSKIAPPLQLFVSAAAGALGAALADLLVNGAASGVAKGANLLAVLAPPARDPLALSWSVFGVAGIASCAHFRPLTRQGACALAFGSAAVLAMLIPAI
ncbi:MAG TPA: hypothetical protein DDZ68_06250 [Parvularcula sp.]|nr:hypothetical protein [Parvularcula sp.]HBS30746.1 hypothetical protein [Parvularcula sp.]HBS33868.1 hypothetical protein [Parvularcula sp.]